MRGCEARKPLLEYFTVSDSWGKNINHFLFLIFLFPSLSYVCSWPQVCILAYRKIHSIHSWRKCLLNTLTDWLQASVTDSFHKHKKGHEYCTDTGLLYLITTQFMPLPGTELTTCKPLKTFSFLALSHTEGDQPNPTSKLGRKMMK